MEFLLHAPSSYYESFKSYWRKRKYQRFTGTRYNSIKKKLKITRLGSRSRPSHRHYSKLTTLSTAPKLGPKILSPIKMLSKFHDGYVTMMVRLAGSLDRSAGSSAMGGNKVKKGGQQVALASTGEEVDSRLVMEIYKKFAASREMTLRF